MELKDFIDHIAVEKGKWSSSQKYVFSQMEKTSLFRTLFHLFEKLDGGDLLAKPKIAYLLASENRFSTTSETKNFIKENMQIAVTHDGEPIAKRTQFEVVIMMQ